MGFVVHRTQQVGNVLNVANGDNLITVFGIEIGTILQRSQNVCIVCAACNRFLEDRRIRGHPAQTVALDEALEFAAGNQVAADVIEPDGLAKLQKVF